MYQVLKLFLNLIYINLQAEKLEVVRLILDTDDKNIIREVKSLFKDCCKAAKKDSSLEEFYDGFRDGVREVNHR